MKIRAKLLQRTPGGGGNGEATLVERLSPSFHCPWLSVVGSVWVVVGSIPPGDFCFVFWENVLFFGAQNAVARDFGGVEKATDGHLTGGSGEVPSH